MRGGGVGVWGVRDAFEEGGEWVMVGSVMWGGDVCGGCVRLGGGALSRGLDDRNYEVIGAGCFMRLVCAGVGGLKEVGICTW